MAFKELHNQVPFSLSVLCLPAPCHWLCTLAISYYTTPFLESFLNSHFCLLCCSTYKNMIFSLAPSSPIKCQDPVQKSGELFFMSHPSPFLPPSHTKNCSPFNCSHIWCLDLQLLAINYWSQTGDSSPRRKFCLSQGSKLFESWNYALFIFVSHP